jgi:hypothetical protein
MGGDRMLSGKMNFGSFKFFMLQAVGITIEVFVCFLWRCLIPRISQGGQIEIPVKVARVTMENDNGNEYRDKSDFNGEKRLISAKSASYQSENLPPMWTRCVGFTWFALWSIWTVAFMMDAMCSTVMTKPQLDLRRLHWFW